MKKMIIKLMVLRTLQMLRFPLLLRTNWMHFRIKMIKLQRLSLKMLILIILLRVNILHNKIREKNKIKTM